MTNGAEHLPADSATVAAFCRVGSAPVRCLHFVRRFAAERRAVAFPVMLPYSNVRSRPMDSFAWKILESRQVIKDQWLSLRADKCQLPNGLVLDPCYVMEYRAWVNVVALTKRQEVVLVREYRYGIQRTLLELPGGSTDPEDVSPLAAIKRELLEETGYTSETFVETGKLCPNPATHNNFLHCFLATNVEQVDKPRLDDTEQIDLVLMPLEQVVELAAKGELWQALHVSSLFLALARLGRVHSQAEH